MGSRISVLCARVRVEEKRLIEALAKAGVTMSALPPSSEPMPLGPGPVQPFAAGAVNGSSIGTGDVILDRCQDRVVAGAVLPLFKANGARMIDAGVAAVGDRLAIMSALNRAGIARPETLLTTSEETGLAAFEALGVPSTLLPLNPGSATIILRDREIAEAVFEHRNVLGTSREAVSLLQKGVVDGARLLVLVAGRTAIAVDGDDLGPHALGHALKLAESAAAALQSGIVAIELSVNENRMVVWDVLPVPEYRGMRPLTSDSIETAVCDFLSRDLRTSALAESNGQRLNGLINREVLDEIALSA